MPVLWSVWWHAENDRYTVEIRNRSRVAGKITADGGRDEALERAVELALERRIPLDCIFESRSPF